MYQRELFNETYLATAYDPDSIMNDCQDVHTKVMKKEKLKSDKDKETIRDIYGAC